MARPPRQLQPSSGNRSAWGVLLVVMAGVAASCLPSELELIGNQGGQGGTGGGGNSGVGAHAGIGGSEASPGAAAQGGAAGEQADTACGNGSVDQASEQCDDGNIIDGDGCSSTCELKCEDLSAVFNPGNRSCYFWTDAMTWSDAQAWCEERGAHLVTISSQAEQDFVESQINQNVIIWIGATDGLSCNQAATGEYQWVTGQPLTFEAWDTDEPDGALQTCATANCYEHCAILRWRDGLFVWSDVCCETLWQPFCEWDAPGYATPPGAGGAGGAGAGGFGGAGDGCSCGRTLPWMGGTAVSQPLQGGSDCVTFQGATFEARGSGEINYFNVECPPEGDRVEWCDTSPQFYERCE